MLSGSYLLSQISERRQAIVTDYEMICAVAPEIKEYATMEEFMWARMCVCSRNFGLVINGVR
jgi:histone-lysine N-methyltransferase SETD3